MAGRKTHKDEPAPAARLSPQERPKATWQKRRPEDTTGPTDVHTDQLADQLAGAESLIRGIPQLIEALQSATVAAQGTLAALDAKTKAIGQELMAYTQEMRTQYEQAQGQMLAGKDQMRLMGQLLARTGEILAVLRAVGDAVETGGDVEPGEEPPPPAARLESSPPESARRTETDPNRPTEQDIPALIEYDARRAATAHRIAAEQRSSMRTHANDKKLRT